MAGNKTQTSGIPTLSNATKGLQRLRRSSKLLRCRSWVQRVLLGKKTAKEARQPLFSRPCSSNQLNSKTTTAATTTKSQLVQRQCSSQSASPLLRLPGELRNKIYVCVFSGIEWPITSWAYQSHTDLITFSALPRTCRQLRAECRLLPYKYAEYELWSTLDFCESLIPLDEEAQAVICDALTELQRHVLLQCQEFAVIFERVCRRE